MRACSILKISGGRKVWWVVLHGYHGARVTHVGDLQFVSINDKGRIGDVIRNWPRIDEARISVVTDGEQHRNGKIGHASLT